MALLHALRRGLNGVYILSGVLAALCLIVILGLIVMQMLARWTGEVFPGAAEYAGYAMAASSFLAFASALNQNSHIRVSILHHMVHPKMQRILEIWCFSIGAATAWYFAYYAQRFVMWSWKFNELSQGQDRTPLWIPQGLMLVGVVIFAIALTDHLIRIVLHPKHRLGPDMDDVLNGE
ncbi:TRAP transporter small permease [Polycladidibacter hongkongensis]|uniref:TRAP transporter small permease n=1 Tax=Polycladidibacter hongkongensis TaxID=1647556 RepID=UPI00082B8B74|nr:TRAP transporter small permease [Pseudovibrio hongkongensis]